MAEEKSAADQTLAEAAPQEGEAAPRPPSPPAPEVVPPPRYNLKLLNRWDVTGISVKDVGLARYINLAPVYVPHSGGRYGNRPFGKAKANLMERLINNMMRTEAFTGKKTKAMKTVRLAFELIEERTKLNPIQVLVDALQNAAPREEVTRLKFGGISVPKAVDISPSRRLDVALRYICQGAVQASFRSTTPIHECLANEVIKASKADISSFAVAKKEELERIASSAR